MSYEYVMDKAESVEEITFGDFIIECLNMGEGERYEYRVLHSSGAGWLSDEGYTTPADALIGGFMSLSELP